MMKATTNFEAVTNIETSHTIVNTMHRCNMVTINIHRIHRIHRLQILVLQNHL